MGFNSAFKGLKEFYATLRQQLFSMLRNIVFKCSVYFETGICCFVSCLNEIG
jgi:hypothetical protein